MQQSSESSDRRPSKAAIYLEDAINLLAVAALFVLAVFFRDRWWGQAGLVGLLVVVAILFVRRLRRVHRSFTESNRE